MKALKVVGVLAAIGGAYFLLSSDDEKKEEKTPINNITDPTQGNLINQLPMEADPFAPIPDISRFVIKISDELPADPANSTPVNPKDEQLKAVVNLEQEHFAAMMNPKEENLTQIAQPIAEGDPKKFSFKAIEKSSSETVPIIIHSFVEQPQTGKDLVVMFGETGEQLKYEDFFHQIKRLQFRKLSLLISISLSQQAPANIFSVIGFFANQMNNKYGIKTKVLQP